VDLQTSASAPLDDERPRRLADRHHLDTIDVHVRGKAGRPGDGNGDVFARERCRPGIDGSRGDQARLEVDPKPEEAPETKKVRSMVAPSGAPR